MPPRPFNVGIWAFIALTGLANAHMGAFHPAMYCINGTVPGVINLNNNANTKPLYKLTYDEYWFPCKELPPDEGKFLEIPAGGSFTVEIADNRAHTSLDPKAKLTDWGDGKEHPDDYSVTNFGNFPPTSSGGVSSPNLHTANQSMAAGTAFGLSYESDISKVTPNNTIVIAVRYHTPWKRVTTYDVPSGLPPCPEAGCTAVFGWIPNGYGISNMYLFPYKAKVIPDSSSPKTIGNPQPAVWCEDDESKCVQGPKQMLIWHQAEGNNIEVEGYDLSRRPKSPAYNTNCGFKDGAQNDIFVDSNAASHSKRMRTRRANHVF